MSTVSYTFSQMQRPNKQTRRPTLIADHQYAWLNMHDFSASSSSSFEFQSMPSHLSAGSYPGGSMSSHSQLTDYDSLPRGIISQEQYQRNRSPSEHEGAPGAHGRLSQSIASTDHFRSQSSDRNGSTASNGSAGQQGYTTHRPDPKKGGRIEKPSVEDDTEPAWRALKTKAGKDRKRLPLACIACRRKKIRCSGEQPACKRCTRSRVPCMYKVGGRKRADSTTEDAGKINDDSNPECGPDGDHEEPTQHSGPHDSNRVMKRRSKKHNSKDNLSLGLNTHGDAPGTMLAGTYGQDEDDLFKEGIDALPSKDMQEHLFEVFFDRVYGQPYYLLHRPTYLRKLRNGGLAPVLVLSVCAVAARFSVSPKLASNSHPFTRGEEWASFARKICLRRYGQPDLTVLNCLILLSIHDFGTGQESSSWSLGGQAIRMAFALRLHENLEYDPRSPDQKLSFVEREERRRAMWACYLLDRFSSADTDQPLFINESVIDTPLPVNERFFELDVPMHTEFIDGGFYAEPDADHDADGSSAHENLGVAALMVRALSVWSGVVMHLKQRHRRSGEALWRELARLEGYSRQNDELLKTLPVHLRWSRENIERHSNEGSIGQYLLLHVSIPLTDLFIYQSIASNIRAGCGGAIANDCYAKANAHTLACAGRISEVLRQGDRLQAATFAPSAGYCALSSFSVQALYLASPNPHINAMTEDNCSINLKYLHRLARHWGKFQEAEQNTHQAFKTALDAVREGGPNTFLQDTEYLHRYSHGMIGADSIQPNMAQDWDEREFSILDQRLELRSIDDFFSMVSVTLQSNQAPDGMQPVAPLLKRRLTAAHLEQQKSEPAGDMTQANINGQQVAIDSVSLPTPRGSFSTGPVKGAMLSQQQASMSAALTSPSSHSYTSSTGLPYHNNNRVDNLGYFGDVMPLGMSQPNSANAQPVFTMPPTDDLPMLEIGNGGWHDDMDGDPFALPADVSSWFLPYEVKASEVNRDMMMAPEGGNVAAQAQQAISPSFNQGIAIRNGFSNNT